MDASLAGIRISPEISVRLLSWIKNPQNMLILLGNPGCGKTYCICAIANFLSQEFNEMRLFTEDSFMKKMHLCMSEGNDYHTELHRLCESEFFIYDDLGSTGHTDYRTEIFFEICDKRYGSMLPTVISSNLTKKEIRETYHERVFSRMFSKENTILEIIGEDKRSPMKIQD